MSKFTLDPKFLSLPEEMQEDVVKFINIVDEQWKSYWTPIEKATPPSRIYHYTSDQGLKGILASGSIWMTDIFSLNDPSELRNGFEFGINELRSKPCSPEMGAFGEIFVSMLSGDIETSAYYFVGCFSCNGDELSQWRAYADHGRGYVLGFDTIELEQAFGVNFPDGAGHHTFPINYNDNKLREMHGNLIGEITPFIDKLESVKKLDENQTQYLKELAVQLAVAFIRSSLHFKHHAYINEAEYRFLQIHSADFAVNGLKIRTRPHSLGSRLNLTSNRP